VFLVHDDKAERFDRRKNRRSRANDNASAALADFVPFIVAFAKLNLALKRSTVCGVSEISGTSTMAPLPCSSAWAMAWR